ncbi:Scavenger receptor class B member 1, partial [Fragariocoptes setiger]
MSFGIFRAPLLKIYIYVGVFIMCLGIACLYGLPALIDQYIYSQIQLTPSSQSYKLWKELPLPIYQKFYFYNVTNGHDIEHLGRTPVLKEIGPFTYSSRWSKRKIVSYDNNQTISFKEYKVWQFERDLSVADHKMIIHTLNTPLAITLTLIQNASNAVRIIVTLSLDGLSEGFFVKRSAKQLLFDGYPDLLTTFGPLLNVDMLTQGGKFGYMNARNNSEDGSYEINTGQDDISKLGLIHRFNGRTELPYWNSKECNSFDGATNGEVFPPIEDNQDSIRLFQPDFCRVWRLDYNQTHKHPSGLVVKRFLANSEILRNSSDFAPNICYYSKKSTDPPPARPVNIRHEWPSGVFTLAPCRFNAPVFMSMPHFLDADPYYLKTVDGLSPSRSKHEFYMDVEPTTGTPINLAARVQLNVAINKPSGLVRFRNMPEIIFPIFWQELSVNLTEDIYDRLLMAANKPDEVTSYMCDKSALFKSELSIAKSEPPPVTSISIKHPKEMESLPPEPEMPPEPEVPPELKSGHSNDLHD